MVSLRDHRNQALPGNSPVALGRSTPRAPVLAVSQDPAVPQGGARALELVQASAVLRAQADSAVHGPASAALLAPLHLLEKHRAHNAPAMPVAAAVASNIPRRRKAR